CMRMGLLIRGVAGSGKKIRAERGACRRRRRIREPVPQLESRQQRVSAQRLVESGGGSEAVGAVEIVRVKGPERGIEDAVASAQDGLLIAEQVDGEAQPRGEIGLIIVDGGAPVIKASVFRAP